PASRPITSSAPSSNGPPRPSCGAANWPPTAISTSPAATCGRIADAAASPGMTAALDISAPPSAAAALWRAAPPRLWPVVAAPFVGSLIALLAIRLPEGEAVLWGRSRCRSCGRTLGALDLVPVASWLMARGHCRHCAAPVSAFYPAIELGALAIAL